MFRVCGWGGGGPRVSALAMVHSLRACGQSKAGRPGKECWQRKKKGVDSLRVCGGFVQVGVHVRARALGIDGAGDGAGSGRRSGGVLCHLMGAPKESTGGNCRMEAQYAFQQKKDMVPLMLEEGYSPNGWLGMLLGVRLWYGFFGSVLTSEAGFEVKMDELCRELGERGK
eukprot:COSAG01_NODE_237_length_20722_cov_360.895747_2_plen_170_part_00